MKCLRCRSNRLIKFLDGFGNKRIYCKGCRGSFLIEYVIRFNAQRSLEEFEWGRNY